MIHHEDLQAKLMLKQSLQLKTSYWIEMRKYVSGEYPSAS
jgi:hypothetical protein